MRPRWPTATTLLILVLIFGSPGTGAQTTPEQVHVTLMGTSAESTAQPPDVSMLAITWHVPDGYLPIHAPRVEYRIENGSVQTAAASEAGRTQELVPPDTDGADIMYAALVAAPRGANVTYRVGEPLLGMSQEFTVRMVPDRDRPIRVVSVADIGGYTLIGDTPEDQQRIRDLILAQDPDLLIIPGDLAYANSDDTWSLWMRMMEPLFARVPVMPVPGNHEWQSSVEKYDQFKARFVLPVQFQTDPNPDDSQVGPILAREQTEEFFGFSAGPAYFVAANSDRVCYKGGEPGAPTGTAPPCEQGSPNALQYSWLHDTLEDAREDHRPAWLIAYFPHPPYSWSNHGDDAAVKALWVPFFETFGVDLVVTGHEHLYERSYPMRGGIPLSTHPDAYAKGLAPVYVVSGGGGRSIYPLNDPPYPPWLAAYNESYHITVMDLSNDTLRVTVLESGNATIVDAFTIHRDAADVPPATPLPTTDARSADWGVAATMAAVILALGIIRANPPRRLPSGPSAKPPGP